ncbi:MAG: GNAT family N-acetyltransferase [Paludibacteraceae bacterium]|nr:GNAT family N-acetyltransferase [Paludibacteraceae bacterium]
MTNKERYAQLCAEHSDIPFFMQHWWLSCVCAGKQWDVWFYEDVDGSVLAAMPYLYRRRLWGVRFVVQPTHSQIGGVWLSPEARADNVKLRNVCCRLMSFLKSLNLWYYYQQFEPDSPLVPLLAGMGFKTRKRITYRLDDISNMEDVESRCSKNKRRQFAKARELVVARELDPEVFYAFHSKTLRDRRKEISYTREYFLVLYNHAVNRGQGGIVSLSDASGKLLAAAFVVWNDEWMYYLIPAFDLTHKETGASARLVLEAVKWASEMNLKFDFEGSMIPGVAKHYKQYAPDTVYYYGVEKVYNPLFRLFRWLYRVVNRKKIR